jgi:hypothetical protein
VIVVRDDQTGIRGLIVMELETIAVNQEEKIEKKQNRNHSNPLKKTTTTTTRTDGAHRREPIGVALFSCR